MHDWGDADIIALFSQFLSFRILLEVHSFISNRSEHVTLSPVKLQLHEHHKGAASISEYWWRLGIGLLPHVQTFVVKSKGH